MSETIAQAEPGRIKLPKPQRSSPRRRGSRPTNPEADPGIPACAGMSEIERRSEQSSPVENGGNDGHPPALPTHAGTHGGWLTSPPPWILTFVRNALLCAPGSSLSPRQGILNQLRRFIDAIERNKAAKTWPLALAEQHFV